VVWYGVHKGTVLGDRFDIHHIDGNKQNNRPENLQPVPRELHTIIGAYTNLVDAEEGYIRSIGRRKPGSNVDARSIKAMRVCSAQLPYGSNNKRIIYDYFAKKMALSHKYCKNISSGRNLKAVLPATPEEEAEILKEYDWLIKKAKAGLGAHRAGAEREVSV
jgi:NADH:ubiquinone oxidoreductase, NADH-binding (51 kD) subunit